MSIGAKPWEGGGSASVPDASETTKGKIRIATSAEATTGTDDLTAMTPLTVKERIDASLVGGVEYKGTFNATTGTPSLLNAEQGDLYVIDVAGTIYGQDWGVGDQLLINADMGGSITNSKINKVDNTDTPASETVAGVIEIATDAEAAAGTATDKALVPSNVSSLSVASSQVTGLSTVATSGAYADISGTPTLATVATTGAYADISGTPTLATVATSGAYADVTGTPDLSIYAPLASPALTGSPTAPTQTQSDGSTKLATTAYVDTAVSGSANPTLDDVTGNGDTTTNAINVGTVTTSGDLLADADATRTIGAEDTRFITTHSDLNGAVRFKAKNDQGSAITKGQVVYIKGVSGTVPTVGLARANSASTMPAFGLALANANDQAEVQIVTFGNLTDYDTTTYSLSANDTVFVSAATAGALTNSAPSGEANLIQNIGRVVRADSSAGIIKVGGAGRSAATPNLDQDKIFVGNASNQAVSTALSAIDLSSFNNDLSFQPLDAGLTSISGLTTSADKMIYTTASDTYAVASLSSFGRTLVSTGDAGAARSALSLGTASTQDVGTTANDVVQLNGSAQLPAVDGSLLTNLPSGATQLNDLSDVTITGASTGEVLRYSGSSWVDATLAYADISGTPTLAAVATSGAYADISGTPTTATETTEGIIEIATNAEAQAASATDKALVPSNIGSIDTGDLNDDGTFLKDLSEDTTPQLGGNLDVNGNLINSVSNGDIEVAPNGTGSFKIQGNATSGSGRIILNCEQNSHGITLKGPPHSAAADYTLTFPNTDGDADQVLKTNGSGVLDWVDQSGGGGGGVTYSAITADPSPAVIAYHYSCTGTFTITIPTSQAAGSEIRIKNMGTGTITLDPQGSNIDGISTDYTMDVQYGALTLVSDGTGWEII